jgi:hypothetical protein
MQTMFRGRQFTTCCERNDKVDCKGNSAVAGGQSQCRAVGLFRNDPTPDRRVRAECRHRFSAGPTVAVGAGSGAFVPAVSTAQILPALSTARRQIAVAHLACFHRCHPRLVPGLIST